MTEGFWAPQLTAIQPLHDPLLAQHHQVHPLLSGNKFWKLKYNLMEVSK